MEKYFLPNGAIYFGNVQSVSKDGFFSERTLYYTMKDEDSVEIDTQEDLEKGLEIIRRTTGGER